MKLSASVVLVVALLSLATGFVDLRARAYPARPYQEFIPAVVNGTADAPERYRVLVPFTLQGVAVATGISPAAIWHSSRLVLFFLAYLTFFVYLATWFPQLPSLLGTALTAATLPLTFTNSWAHPDHAAELLLFTAACLAIARERTAWLFVLLVLATLNRETSVFLVALYLVAGPLNARRFMLTAGLGATWFFVYVGLRAWRGFVHYDYFQLARNIEFLRLLPENYDPYYRSYAYFGFALFGGLLLVAFRGRRAMRPVFAGRALLVVPLFALVALTISSIIEVRILTPLYPLIMPAVMSALLASDIPRDPAKAFEHHV